MKRSLLAIGLLLAGCRDPAPARDQWLITVSTDGTQPQFGDRLLVEVLDAAGDLACDGCRRTFGATADAFPLSFGVPVETGAVQLRGRLYRVDQTGTDGFPGGTGLIDARGHLPEANGVTPVTLNLTLDCFGLPSQPDATCDSRTGQLGPIPVLDDAVPLEPASWWGLQPAPCSAPVADDMACIEGGAFIQGDAKDFGISAALSAARERLVVLRPFALERDEVTVGEVRSLVRAGVSNVTPVLPSPDPMDPDGTCTYLGPDDASNDALPVNCVTHQVAANICAALGRRLPTEAEWEWAAGQRDLETLYPWGSDPDVCENAIIGVGRLLEAYFEESIPCRVEDDGTLRPWGVQPGGDPDDVTVQGIANLGGNVSEWTADAFAPYGEACHLDVPRPAVDPLCFFPSSTMVVRGGSWNTILQHARAVTRQRSSSWAPIVGVRCAQSM